jgi:hypothetical protein
MVMQGYVTLGHSFALAVVTVLTRPSSDWQKIVALSVENTKDARETHRGCRDVPNVRRTQATSAFLRKEALATRHSTCP